MAYTAWSVVANEQPSTAKWNIIGTNMAGFNDGTAIGTNAIAAASLATNAITLGYTQITTPFTTTAVSTTTDVTSLAATVTVPAGGRRCRITAVAPYISGSGGAPNLLLLMIRETGTVLQQVETQSNANVRVSMTATYSAVLSAGSHTYQVSISQNNAGTLTFQAGATQPAFILVEAI